MLVTPLRDGMNLVAKEYVAAKVDGRGALVLSEFTGAADKLSQAWLVNPYDIRGMKSTIMAALGEPAEAAPPHGSPTRGRDHRRRGQVGGGLLTSLSPQDPPDVT